MNFAVIYLENPKEEYKFNAGIKLTAARYEEKIDAVCFEIIFSSVDAWNYYHQASHQKSQPDKVFLFSKKESTSMFPFSAVDKNGTLIADRYREVYLSASRGLSFESKLIEEYSPQFVYSYSTYFSSLKSDADLRISNSGQYTHFWIREYKDVKTHCNTTLYYYQVNKGMWILLTLILVILSLGIFLIIYKRKNKLQKYK